MNDAANNKFFSVFYSHNEKASPGGLFSAAKNVELKIHEWPLLPIEEPQLLRNLWF